MASQRMKGRPKGKRRRDPDDEEAQINPVSEWEELEEIEGVTLFELQGPPHVQITDPSVVRTYGTRTLNEELTCPICLGILRDTMIVMECLHRFCGECIQKCLRMGMKECPACRIHIGTRRSLRSDPNFDALITTIYPDLDAYEKRELDIITEINRSSANNSFTRSCAQSIVAQKRLRNKRVTMSKRSTRRSAPISRKAQTEGARRSRGRSRSKATRKPKPPRLVRLRNRRKGTTPKRHTDAEPEDEALAGQVGFVLKRHPLDKSIGDIRRQYLTTPKELQVKDIKEYLSVKLGSPSPGTYSILLTKKDPLILNDAQTISALYSKYGPQQGPLVLHYSSG